MLIKESDTMTLKKTAAIIVSAVTVFFALALTVSANTEYIGAEKAKEIALADAGLKSTEVKFARAKLEFDDGIYEYDIEFYKGSTEYDYSVDALTGKILEKDFDAEYIRKKSEPKLTVKYKITADEAKAIALKHAEVDEADVTFARSNLTFDDGVYEYEVEFYLGNTEYDYDINAVTGKITSFDSDADWYTPKTRTGDTAGTTAAAVNTTKSEKLTAAQAEAIALKHAGLSASDVRMGYTEYDFDDGRFIYEIEFYSGWTEYSYSIDAYSGKILEYERDND
jgi:uncharacterized membrane protein YkoI